MSYTLNKNQFVTKLFYSNRSKGFGTLESKIATNDGLLGRLSEAGGFVVDVDCVSLDCCSGLLGQYRASETMPSRPGRQFTPSWRCSTPAPGHNWESSTTHVPSAEFSSFLPLLPLGTLNRTRHLRPRPHWPKRFLNPPHFSPLDLAHVRHVLHSSGRSCPVI